MLERDGVVLTEVFESIVYKNIIWVHTNAKSINETADRFRSAIIVGCFSGCKTFFVFARGRHDFSRRENPSLQHFNLVLSKTAQVLTFDWNDTSNCIENQMSEKIRDRRMTLAAWARNRVSPGRMRGHKIELFILSALFIRQSWRRKCQFRGQQVQLRNICVPPVIFFFFKAQSSPERMCDSESAS